MSGHRTEQSAPDSLPGAAVPAAYCLGHAADRGVVEDLLRRDEAVMAPDRLRHQAAELARVRGLSGADLRVLIMGGLEEDSYARLVHLPWHRTLVKVLPRADFIELRTARNRQKLTLVEQLRLGQLRVGVVGLSVGASCARLLAMERLAGELRLADFDRLALSNLNRLQCGVHQLGMNKAVLAAQCIWDNDPYLPVGVFESGVTEETCSDFFDSHGRPLDLVVEECDDLYVKLLVRREAKRRGVPVLMATDDRGTIDVERFDLEPARPLLHGLLGQAEPEDLRGLAPEDRQRLVLRILGDAPSARLAKSFEEMAGGRLAGWPQLGSEVLLGAVQVACAVRRIGLGQPLPSGRYHTDPWAGHPGPES